MTTIEEDDGIPTQGRGPAYPYIPLRKAIERIEQIRDANMSRTAVAPFAFYRAWGFTSENGNARQTMAALNHYGLVDYIGRGKEREVKLSPLAQRIVFDKIPNSKERAMAIRESALTPYVYADLWEKFGVDLPPDYAIETYLIRDREFSDAAARNVIGGYRDTFDYAGLQESANNPDQTAEQSEIMPPVNTLLLDTMRSDIGKGKQVVQTQPQSVDFTSEPVNSIKVMLDGDRLQVSAYVDIKGAKRLLKALKANMALLEDDEGNESDATD